LIGNSIVILSDASDIANSRPGATDPNETVANISRLQAAVVKALSKLETKSCFLDDDDDGGLGKSSSSDTYSSAYTRIFSPKATNCVVVGDKGEVRVPRGWLPLLVGEKVLDSRGFVYRLNFFDHLRSCITMGCAYLMSIREKRKIRTAIIITNMRIVTMYIEQRAGMLPSHMTNFCLSVSSYFPGIVCAGVVSFDGSSKIVSSLACTSSSNVAVGSSVPPLLQLQVTLSNSQIYCPQLPSACDKDEPFDASIVQLVMRMHKCHSRALPLALQQQEFVKSEVKKAGFLDVTAMASKAVDSIVSSVESGEARSSDFNDQERRLLPLLKNEKFVNRFSSTSPQYLSCCSIEDTCFCGAKVDTCHGYLCSPSCGSSSPSVATRCLFLLCVKAATCGLRPFALFDFNVISDRSIYHFSVIKNYPWPCLGVKQSAPSFCMAWSPIRSLQAQKFIFLASGMLPVNEKTGFCGLCTASKRKGPSVFCLEMDLGAFSFAYSDDVKDKNYLRDDEVVHVQKVLNQVQVNILNEQNGHYEQQPPVVQAMARNAGDADQ